MIIPQDEKVYMLELCWLYKCQARHGNLMFFSTISPIAYFN